MDKESSTDDDDINVAVEMTSTSEIEITAEMVGAGLKVFRESGVSDEPLGADSLVVAEIYQAMRRASLLPHPKK